MFQKMAWYHVTALEYVLCLQLYMYECLKILAWDKKDTYEDYIKNIKKNRGIYPEAYWVKIADIKDHLIQKETLEDGAREKYIAALLQLL